MYSQHRDVLALAEQSFHSTKAFDASHPPESGLGVHKELGGNTAGADGPNWPKGNSVLYGVI